MTVASKQQTPRVATKILPMCKTKKKKEKKRKKGRSESESESEREREKLDAIKSKNTTQAEVCEYRPQQEQQQQPRSQRALSAQSSRR